MTATNNRDAAKAWLRHRLLTEQFSVEWETLLRSSIERFLSFPVNQLISEKDFNRIVSDSLTTEVMNALCRELVVPFFHHLIVRLGAETTTAKEWTTAETLERLVSVIESPGVIQREWIEQFFKQEAVSEVLVDSIYSALREFSTIIPRLVLRSLPSGRFKALGLAGNLTEKIASQLEKIIEPEIRSFLNSSSQSLISRACEFTAGQLDSPTSRSMRANLLRFGVEQQLSFHIAGIDETKRSVLENAIKHHFDGVSHNPAFLAAIERETQEFFTTHGHRSLTEIAPDLGAELLRRTEVIAMVSLPHVRNLIEVPQVSDWLDSLVDELLDVYDQ